MAEKIVTCINCKTEIPVGRLKAIPGTKTCTECTSTDQYYVNQIVNNDEDYNELEIIRDPNSIAEMQRYKNEMNDKPAKGDNE